MAKKGKHFRALDEAKAAGYIIKVAHQRNDLALDTKLADLGRLPEPYQSNLRKIALSEIPDRGVTVVVLLDEFRNPVAEGMAACSWADQYNRRLGVQIACGRALKQAQGR